MNLNETTNVILTKNIPCKLDKTKDGHLTSLDNAKICDVNAKTASTVTARYYKGIGANRDNMCIVVMRGRNHRNPSDRTAGVPTEERFEKKPVVIDIYNRRQIDGDVCGTITAGVAKAGSGTFGILSSGKTDREKTDEKRFFRQALETFEKNECVPGDTVNGYNRTVDRSGLCPTLTTRPEGFKTAVLPVTADYRIRKLTPKECFRLMAVSDEDADRMLAVNSNSQCYKQAGNSIVVSVLEALFRNLNIRGVETWNEVKDSYDPYCRRE